MHSVGLDVIVSHIESVKSQMTYKTFCVRKWCSMGFVHFQAVNTYTYTCGLSDIGLSLFTAACRFVMSKAFQE